MKKLKTPSEELCAEKIIRTNSSIIGICNKQEIFKFSDINDFSIFQLYGGDWDISDEEIEKLQKYELVQELAKVKIENIQKDAITHNSIKELANVKIEIMKLKGSVK